MTDDDDLHVLAATMTDAERKAPVDMGTFVVVAAGIDDRLAGLERRLAAAEERSLAYRGVFSRANRYARGDITTHQGSLWFCATDTNDPPGGSLSWVLMAKGSGGK